MADHETSPVQLQPIGVLRTCFKEKFGIPRQAGLAPAATGIIELTDDPRMAEAVKGLSDFRRIWVITHLHQQEAGVWNARVRPPRLGGEKSVGVFATRSPHRPNGLGLSLFELVAVDVGRRVVIHVAGVDILDGTPVLDIKPYLAYCDRPTGEEDEAHWAATRPAQALAVKFSVKADQADPELKELIRQCLSQDPRPAFQRRAWERESYACRLRDVDVHWVVENGVAEVTEIRPLDQEPLG